MSDSWLQRLIVRGSMPDVAAFRRSAEGSTGTRYVTVKRQVRTQKLSFVQLRALLPPVVARRIEDPEEPWDLVIEPLRRFSDGTVELTYKFQLSAFVPDELVHEVSRLHPRLCFVVACVAPSADSQYSELVQHGRRWSWTLPRRRKNAIWAKVPKETDDNADEVTFALAEADWAMMDMVVEHWEDKARQLLPKVRNEPGTVRRRRSVQTRSKQGTRLTPDAPSRRSSGRRLRNTGGRR